MQLTYNGVIFDLIRITDFTREVVKTPDESTYLYDSINIRCDCLLNISLNSFPTGATAQNSYLNICNKLKEPRQQLTIVSDSDAGPVIILQSPLPGFSQDFRIGPTCTVHHLDPFHGTGSLWMDMEFHTDIGCTSQSYVLANRFTWSIAHEPDGFLAIHMIKGMAHFRVDKMVADQVTPDILRPLFIPPVPAGFRRDPPSLVIYPDMDAVEYEIVDREQQLNFVGGFKYHATKIEIELNREFGNPDLA